MASSPFRRIAEVKVEHGYFQDGICRTVDFRPDQETERHLARHKWLLRRTDGGFSIHALADSLPATLACRFTGHPEDPSFGLYTANSTQASKAVAMYSDSRLEADGTTMVRVSASGEENGGTANGMIVDLRTAHEPLEGGFLEGPVYRIRLEPRKFHWKYFLLGEFARPCLEVFDPEGQIRFQEANPGGFSPCRSVVSEHAIAIRQISSQRLQLRDLETGRVVIKRLPLPDIRKLGRERLPTGETTLVAETFINP